MQMNSNAAKTETNNLVLYFILAYAIFWAIGIPLALQRQGVIAPVLPYWVHYFVGYGPLLSAALVTGSRDGKPGPIALGKSMPMWKVGPIWWAAALSQPLFGALVVTLITGEPITIASLGEVNFLPQIGLAALPLWFLTFGLGEEIGWRGYALPRLQRSRSALSASVILFAFWALWHLSQFFYLFDPTITVGWLLGLVLWSDSPHRLFNSARGSILLMAVWHGSFNFSPYQTPGIAFLRRW